MRRSVVLFAALLVIAAPLVGSGLRLDANWAARAAFARSAGAIDGLRATRITADPWHRTMTVYGLVYHHAGVTWHVGRLMLPFSSPTSLFASTAYAQETDTQAASPNAAAGEISAENISIDVDAMHYAIKRIDISGTRMTMADLDALTDVKSTVPIADRIARLSAALIASPAITTKAVFGDQTQTATYNDIVLHDVVQGRAGSVTIGNITTRLESPDGGPVQSVYGTTKVTNFDLALAAKVSYVARTDDAEPLRTLYDSVTIAGAKISDESAHFELVIGSLAGERVKARSLLTPLMSEAAVMAARGNAPANRQAAGYLADVLGSFEVGGLELKDVHFAVASGDEALTGTLGRAFLSNMAMAKISDAGLENYTIEGTGATTKGGNFSAKVGGFRIRNLDLTGLRDQLLKTAAGEQASVGDPGASIRLVREILLTGLDVDIPTTMTSDGRFHFDVAQVDYDDDSPVDGVPTHLSTSVDHFRFGLTTMNNAMFGNLAALGYDVLDLSGRLEAHFNASQHRLAFDAISLSGMNMGSVKLAGTLDDATRELFSNDQTKVEAAALALRLQRFELNIENAGLFERLLAADAKKDDMSPAEVRQSYLESAAVEVPSVLGNSAGAKSIGAAIAKFIMAPKNLRITGVAPDGLGVAELALVRDPGALLDQFSIDAAADE